MVSIVMPAYNEEQALPHSLNALFRQEGTYEVVLVDGGSSDRTRAIAES
jgi:glycosyltransferase involved in cell wall biosynthesis